MSFLYVLEGDEQALGEIYDLHEPDFRSILTLARSLKKCNGFPLARRANHFLNDTLYDADEIEALMRELQLLKEHSDIKALQGIIELCQLAIANGCGIECIAD